MARMEPIGTQSVVLGHPRNGAVAEDVASLACLCCGEGFHPGDHPRLYCGSSTRCAPGAGGCRGLCLNADRRGSTCDCCGAFIPKPAHGPVRRFCRSSHKACQTPACIRLCKARLPDDPALIAAYREARRG
jgi:hypothetical protein